MFFTKKSVVMAKEDFDRAIVQAADAARRQGFRDGLNKGAEQAAFDLMNGGEVRPTPKGMRILPKHIIEAQRRRNPPIPRPPPCD